MDWNVADYLNADGKPRDAAPLGMLLSAQARRLGDAAALVIGDCTWSFAQLDEAANRFARYLAGIGVAQNHRAVLCLPNRAELIQAIFALWKLGAVPCPISYRLVTEEFAALVALVEPICVIGDSATPAVPGPFVNVDHALWDGLSSAVLPAAISVPGKILASGGSTGRPKLIVDPLPAVWGPDKCAPYRPAGITLLNAGPICHSAPFTFCNVALAEGSRIICMQGFDPVEWLHLVETHRPQLVSLVPTMMSRIAKLSRDVTRKADLSSIETLFHAAAPCPPEIKRWWIERLGPEKVLEIYGGSERIGATVINGYEWLAHPGSVGRPVPGDEIVIVGDDGEVLAPQHIGEINFRRRVAGPGKQYSYIGADPRIRDDLDTFGDLGWVDDDGYLYIADRRTDMVVVAGMNVYPAEIEAAIEKHAQVLCSAVIGLPHDDVGNCLHAVVELTAGVVEPVDGHAFLADELGSLSPYKRPRSIEFTHDRVRDDAGKVRRAALRAARLPPG